MTDLKRIIKARERDVRHRMPEEAAKPDHCGACRRLAALGPNSVALARALLPLAEAGPNGERVGIYEMSEEEVNAAGHALAAWAQAAQAGEERGKVGGQ